MVNRKKILIFAAAAVLGASLPAPGGIVFAAQTEDAEETAQAPDPREAVLADVGDGAGLPGGGQAGSIRIGRAGTYDRSCPPFVFRPYKRHFHLPFC